MLSVETRTNHRDPMINYENRTIKIYLMECATLQQFGQDLQGGRFGPITLSLLIISNLLYPRSNVGSLVCF